MIFVFINLRKSKTIYKMNSFLLSVRTLLDQYINILADDLILNNDISIDKITMMDKINQIFNAEEKHKEKYEEIEWDYDNDPRSNRLINAEQRFISKCLTKYKKAYSYPKVYGHYIDIRTDIEVLCNRCGEFFTITPRQYLYNSTGHKECTGTNKIENEDEKQDGIMKMIRVISD